MNYFPSEPIKASYLFNIVILTVVVMVGLSFNLCRYFLAALLPEFEPITSILFTVVVKWVKF